MTKVTANALNKLATPMKVGVAGCGWCGSRIASNLNHLPNVEVQTIFDIDGAKARATHLLCGALIDHDMKNVDVVVDATGDILAGAELAMQAFNCGIHFVTTNSALDSTIGLILVKTAEEAGVVYTNIDGDQPGCLARMLDEIITWGFTPQIAGNCKEFLDVHATPQSISQYVQHGLDPYQVCQFTDGTKQAMELASVCNGYGYSVFGRGCYGPTCRKSEIVTTFEELIGLNSIEKGHVDFTLGSCESYGGPVFVIASTQDECLRSEMEHLKKGSGPSFLFFRDYHLVSVEAPSSIVEAVLFKSATLAPTCWVTDVVAVAKKDLVPHHLEGTGGYDCYGVCDRSGQDLLPMGLAEFASLKESIERDDPIPMGSVDLEENLVTKLRAEQDRLLPAST